MKRFTCILLLAACLGGGGLHAQDLLEVRRVELDSLVRFLRKEFRPDIYYVKDEAEQSTFSVSAPRAQFLESAFDALREKGYVVSEYGSARFILHSKSVFTSLPTGYFDSGKSLSDDSELQKYLAEQSAVVTFQNKVYEIGESSAGRHGKVYLSGHVRDVASGEPLTGVSVYDEKSGAYTVTDVNGFYRLALPVGDNLLNLSGYSLDDMHLTLKVWDDGVLDVVMKEKVLALNSAVISADAVSHHRDAKMGLERVRMEVINKIPSAFGEGDIIKAVLTLPGVKSVGEASSGFNVRGGSTDQNLILFNDGTIYNPTHLFGIFSAFNPDIVSEVELYKSSIPAEFGGRISSVLDVRSREGNANKIAGSMGIGLLTSRFHLEGPLVKDRTTFLLGGRTTYSNWLLNLLPKNSEYAGGKASFSDVNASLTHKINDANTLQAYVYWSRDGFEFSRDPAFRYANLNASLKWRNRISSRLNLTASAGYDRYGARLDNSLGRNQMSGYRVETQIHQGFGKLIFSYGVSDAHSLTFGANTTYYNLQPGAMSPLYEGESLVRTWALDRQQALEPALFASDNWTVTPKLSFEGGVRLSGLLALNPAKFYLTPELRLSGKYSFLDNLSVKAGFNTMSQHIHLISNTSSISPIDTWQLSTAGRRRPVLDRRGRLRGPDGGGLLQAHVAPAGLQVRRRHPDEPPPRRRPRGDLRQGLRRGSDGQEEFRQAHRLALLLLFPLAPARDGGPRRGNHQRRRLVQRSARQAARGETGRQLQVHPPLLPVRQRRILNGPARHPAHRHVPLRRRLAARLHAAQHLPHSGLLPPGPGRF